MSNWYTDQIKFEKSLQPGQSVEVRWTNCHRYYGVAGKVTKVNGASVRVALTEAVLDDRDVVIYPIGREIVVPRATNARGFPVKTFSVNNGAFALSQHGRPERQLDIEAEARQARGEDS